LNDLKGLVIAAEAIVLLVLGAANIVSGQFLGAAILIGIASLTAACAWALCRPALIDKVASHGSDRLD
jgi:hypothetical protein